jgi:hypothetical protein
MSRDKIKALELEQTLAEVFSEAHLISTNTEQSSPIFDHAALAGIFSEPLSLSSSTIPSPPSFDHQALAEMFSERPPVSIDPQPSPFSFDTWSSPPPLFGQLEKGEPVAKTVAVAPSTNAESARPHRAEPLLAKLRYIFSTKAEPLSSRIEKDSLLPSLSVQLQKLEPVAKAIPAASPTDAESARLQQARSLLTELSRLISTNSELPSLNLEQEPSAPRLSGQPGNVMPAVSDVAATSPAGSESARPPPATSLLAETSSLISTDTERSLPIFEKNSSRPTLSGQPNNVEPAAEIVAAASPIETESARPQQAKSLVAELPPLISTDTKPSPPYFETEPSCPTLSSQLNNLEPATTVAVAPPTHAVAMEPQQTKLLPLADLPLLVSTNKNPSSPIFEEDSLPPSLYAQLDNVEPAEKAVAVAPPTDAQSTLPTQAKSLPAEKLSPISTNIKPSSPFEEAPSRPSFYGRLGNVGPAVRAVAVSLPPTTDGAVTRAQQAKSLLAELDLNTAIRLRWVLRDIRGKRTAISPASENDLATLIDLGLVEMREKRPRLTASGVLALD